jgi:hypothetical protein
LLFSTGLSVALIDPALRKEHGQRLGPEVDFEEVVIFPIPSRGHRVQVGLEIFRSAALAEELTPVRWFSGDLKEFELPGPSKLFEPYPDACDSERVCQECRVWFPGPESAMVAKRRGVQEAIPGDVDSPYVGARAAPGSSRGALESLKEPMILKTVEDTGACADAGTIRLVAPEMQFEDLPRR